MCSSKFWRLFQKQRTQRTLWIIKTANKNVTELLYILIFNEQQWSFCLFCIFCDVINTFILYSQSFIMLNSLILSFFFSSSSFFKWEEISGVDEHYTPIRTYHRCAMSWIIVKIIGWGQTDPQELSSEDLCGTQSSLSGTAIAFHWFWELARRLSICITWSLMMIMSQIREHQLLTKIDTIAADESFHAMISGPYS